ncbi:MAG TPA: methyltransferase domain-containing protein [Candidatus Binataceae bacterium]
MRGLRVRRATGGPASDIAGIAWLNVDTQDLDAALGRLHGLGYTAAVDLVTPIEDVKKRERLVVRRWHGQQLALVGIWAEEDEELRANAPDRRSFLLECADGVTRRIVGYRGGTGPLEHRALPVEDARLLVNLVSFEAGGRFLDPFAGAGAVIIEARSRGFTTTSLDIDRALRFGLAELSGHHVVGDASALPFADHSFDAVGSEPPYHWSAVELVKASIREAARVIRHGARIAFLVTSKQATPVREAGERAGLILELEAAVDRKGTEVSCFCWIGP